MKQKVVDVLIFGIEGTAKEAYYIISKMNNSSNYVNVYYNVLGFVGEDIQNIGQPVCDGKSIVACDENVENIILQRNEIGLIISFGGVNIKEKLYEKFKVYSNVIFPNLIHPTVNFETQISIGIGNMFGAGVVFAPECTVGDFNLVHLNSTIGHNTKIGNYNTINPMSSISGNVNIKSSCLVGTGANVLQGIRIQDKSVIGAGAVVTKDVAEGTTVVGVPAHELGMHKTDMVELYSRVCIIAEAGVNHNGDLDYAKKLTEAAKMAGADVVKFQTAIPEKLVSKFAEKADYQRDTTNVAESQLEMIKKLSLSEVDFIEIKQYCEEIGIEFLSTPFDLESVDFLQRIGIKKWKIPSGEITNLPYLVKIAKTGFPVILSTGMCTIDEVGQAVKVLEDNGGGKISLLHCNTEYPTPFEDANIRAMLNLREKFRVEIGYSDHTMGIEAPIAAVALGATIIEKHFTLDKNMEGPDHKASLEPSELKNMVDSIRNIEKALGTGVKAPTKSELKNKDIARKSIVANRDILKGEMFTEENITVKRPGNGISPMNWFDVVGKNAVRFFEEDELIEL